jgi:hypothetical protein
MGVRVVIMLPGDLPDKIKVTYPEIAQPVPQPAAQPEIAVPGKPAEAIGTVPQTPSEPSKEAEQRLKPLEQASQGIPAVSGKELTEGEKTEAVKAKRAPVKEGRKTEAKGEGKAASKKGKKPERKKGK